MLLYYKSHYSTFQKYTIDVNCHTLSLKPINRHLLIYSEEFCDVNVETTLTMRKRRV